MTKADKLEKKQDKRFIKSLKKDKEFQELMKQLYEIDGDYKDEDSPYNKYNADY